jgi:lysophospholipase L1-like esterase
VPNLGYDLVGATGYAQTNWKLVQGYAVTPATSGVVNRIYFYTRASAPITNQCIVGIYDGLSSSANLLYAVAVNNSTPGRWNYVDVPGSIAVTAGVPLYPFLCDNNTHGIQYSNGGASASHHDARPTYSGQPSNPMGHSLTSRSQLISLYIDYTEESALSGSSTISLSGTATLNPTSLSGSSTVALGGLATLSAAPTGQTVILGYDEIGNTYYHQNNWKLVQGLNVVAQSNGVSTRIAIYTNAMVPATNECIMMVYDGTGAGASLLVSMLVNNLTPGQWNYIDISGDINIIAGNTYAVTMATGTHGITYDAGTGTNWYQVLPASYTSEPTTTLQTTAGQTARLSMFLEYESSAPTGLSGSGTMSLGGAGVLSASTSMSGSATISLSRQLTGTPYLLTLGDSNTAFNNWRWQLEELLGEGVYNFRGPYNSGSGFDNDHGGRSGDTIADLTNRLSTALNTMTNAPENSLAYIMIGTNDVDRISDTSVYAARAEDVGEIIDSIYTFNPALKILVGNVIPNGNDAEDLRVDIFNPLLESVVLGRNSLYGNVRYVDVNSTLKENVNWETEYYSDELHINNAGGLALATEVYDAIEASLYQGATLTGIGSVAGSGTISLGGIGALTGIDSVAGSEIISISGTGALTGIGSTSGSSTISLSGTGTLSEATSMSGTGSVSLSGSGTLTGVGSVSGSGTISLSGTGLLAGIGSLSGLSIISLSGSGALTGIVSISGSSTIMLDGTGTLTSAGTMSGNSTISLGGSGTLTGISSVSGSGTISLDGSGTITGISSVSGSATFTLGGTGTLSNANELAGSSTISFGGSGTLTGIGSMSGSSTISFGGTGTLHVNNLTIPQDRIIVPEYESRLIVAGVYNSTIKKIKNPNSILSFVIDWSTYIPDDVISQSVWINSSNTIIDYNHTINSLQTQAYFSNGQSGESAVITNRITTAGGRVLDFSFVLEIRLPGLLVRKVKDPDATDDFAFNCLNLLGDDLIASSTWNTSSANIQVVNTSINNGIVSAFFRGGIIGESALVTNVVDTLNDLRFVNLFKMDIRSL